MLWGTKCPILFVLGELLSILIRMLRGTGRPKAFPDAGMLWIAVTLSSPGLPLIFRHEQFVGI